MSEHVQHIIARGDAWIVEGPVENHISPRHQIEVDQNFELPKALYGVTVGCYLGFLGLMFAGFSSPGLAIPMVIFVGFIIAGFGVPALWTRLKGNTKEPLSMGVFSDRGIMTNTGPLAARDATIQVLILPALIVAWGIAVLVIAALVS